MSLNNAKSQLLLLFLSLLGLLAFFGSGVYLVYKLNLAGVITAAVLAILALGLIIRQFWTDKQVEDDENDGQLLAAQPHWRLADYLFLVAYLFVFFLAILLLFNFQTAKALVSPWTVLPPIFFWLYVAGTAIIFGAIFKRTRVALILTIFHYFLTFSVALIVYRLGYGYDPFIHQASLKIIDAAGAIYPKTFYYLGQYSLEMMAHKLFFVPLQTIDLLLVPVLAALSLPVTLNYVLHRKYADFPTAKLIILLLLVFPTSLFILTVPQNLAYLFLLLVIILSFAPNNKLRLATIWSLSLVALMTQPIAGVPAVALAVWQTIKLFHWPLVWKKVAGKILVAGNAIGLPFLFFISGQAKWRWSLNIFSWSWPHFPNQENFVLNFLYLLAFNKIWILFLIILLSAWLALKAKSLRPYFYGFLSLLFSYVISTQLVFGGLAAKEQSDYPQRILIAALLFLVPIICVLFYQVSERLRPQPLFIKISILGLAVILICSSLYLSYPRSDRYFDSHGYSVSAADVKAVQLIAADAGATDYLVLANQQVGAAAVSQFGLKKYYRGDIFYYSIQTGYPLYDYYLAMLAAPTRQTMNAAMDYLGVKQSYFVLDKYWWNSKKIYPEAQLTAATTFVVDNGEVYIFKYLRN